MENKEAKTDKKPLRLTITVDGEEYPAFLTNGALLRFQRETGHDLEHTDGGFADTFTLLWCCVKSACKREGKKFGMSLEDFADATDPSDIEAWGAQIFGADSSDEADDSDGVKKKHNRAIRLRIGGVWADV